jgi:hypothetical protein
VTRKRDRDGDDEEGGTGGGGVGGILGVEPTSQNSLRNTGFLCTMAHLEPNCHFAFLNVP